MATPTASSTPAHGSARARITGDSRDLAYDIHRTKTALFTDRILNGEISGRAGLAELITDLADSGVRIGIATTGRRRWVEPLVRHVVGSGLAEVIVTGDDVDRLKPRPEAYLKTLEALALPAEAALAVEDSAIGLRAARAAGLATLVVTNGHTADQDFPGAAAVLSGFDTPRQLRAGDCQTLLRNWWAART
ncbi:HAD-IA family hydrolase [Mycobacterium shigaense]|uniref:Haloacid dehalogenase n=1 Tax=Mycobacterium shigaense TaxID=722731 RepID=A0A1Z4EHU5_9MYCO|nr:HAD-IA family hydrolase [Mycobacterium shigaense]MEA1124728.1 HAD-IA family hydrolase [Mycobacterium shigaense]PRI14110.1 hypothetical protein B2J96_16970 [Mycobacterium shigaense]BAX92543.1 haloacid dehalogenase [Mycobacterium shigaense]